MSTPHPVHPYRPSGFADAAPEFSVPGITAEAGRGVAWITEGWALFKQDPLMWILAMIIVLGISMAVGFIPMIGSILSSLIWPMLNVGILAFARGLEQGEAADINRLFIGFQQQDKRWTLVGVGGVYLAMTMVVAVIAIVLLVVMFLAGGGMEALSSASSSQAMEEMMRGGFGLGILLVMLIALSVLLLVAAPAYFFAPALVFYANVDIVTAFRESFTAVWRNWLSVMLVYSTVAVVIFLVACIPFGLGLFVAIPVMMASTYPCFRDIFGRRPGQSGAFVIEN